MVLCPSQLVWIRGAPVNSSVKPLISLPSVWGIVPNMNAMVDWGHGKTTKADHDVPLD
jgi:hypothetical protein